MKIEKSFELKHPRQLVWSRMNDVHFVAQCLPGASIVEDLGEHRYKGRMSVKVGPMAAAFDGEIAIESQPRSGPRSCPARAPKPLQLARLGQHDLSVERGRRATATRVEVVSDINLAGSLAQFGKGAIMQEVANRITAEFIKNFERSMSTAPGRRTPRLRLPPRRAQALDAGNLFWSILRDRFLAFFRRRLIVSSGNFV